MAAPGQVLELRSVTFGYAPPPLLDEVDLVVTRGERIGLIGRNGAGKSTLMRLIAGEIAPDNGSITMAEGCHAAYLTQHVPADLSGCIFDRVADGIPRLGADVAAFRRWEHQAAVAPLTAAEQSAMDQAAARIGAADGWDLLHRAQRTVEEMGLDPNAPFESLSAGMKRRVLLARALASQPELLLLDEPTNHLDIDSIEWLQSFLSRFEGALMFVTHDRVFLQALAGRIVEVDRGRLFDWECDYAMFLKRRDAMLAAEAAQNAEFDRKLAEEERWIRQGIKARRTRNEGRVRALKAMRAQRRARREKLGAAKLELQEADRSGRLVLRAENVSFAYDDRPIVSDLSVTVFRGDRIGLIGPNGVGKTTLLKVLLGQLPPQHGTVRTGTNLQIAYFDQLRAVLDEDRPARENVADGADFVTIGGNRRHVMGYLQDFLFSADRAQTRVGFLSGGERNRLMLARLFSQPANVLVLDEPTNDLDAETLELLEDVLGNYAGTVLLVSHDRAFLNNVVTSTLVFEGEGVVREYDGGYDDWLRQRKPLTVEVEKPRLAQERKPTPDDAPPARKLSFKEQRELEALPKQIEELENRIAEIHDRMASPSFFKQSGEEIAAVNAELKTLETELADCYERWEGLESGV